MCPSWTTGGQIWEPHLNGLRDTDLRIRACAELQQLGPGSVSSGHEQRVVVHHNWRRNRQAERESVIPPEDLARLGVESRRCFMGAGGRASESRRWATLVLFLRFGRVLLQPPTRVIEVLPNQIRRIPDLSIDGLNDFSYLFPAIIPMPAIPVSEAEQEDDAIIVDSGARGGQQASTSRFPDWKAIGHVGACPGRSSRNHRRRCSTSSDLSRPRNPERTIS